LIVVSVIVAVIVVSFCPGACLPVSASVAGENTASAAIVAPLRNRVRHDWTDMAVGFCAAIVCTFLLWCSASRCVLRCEKQGNPADTEKLLLVSREMSR
jgi:hypothetical protein